MVIASPKADVKPPELAGRDIVLLVDRSGSMRGDAMTRTVDGIIDIVGRLTPKDRLEVIPFNGQVAPFFGGLEEVDEALIAEASRMARQIDAAGMTDIGYALQAALSTLDADAKPGRAQAIIFLTDGQDFRSPSTVLKKVRKANTRARIYSFGLGSAVNLPFLKQLAEQNRGTSTYISQASDVDAALAAVFERIETPIMMGLRLQLDGASPDAIHPERLPDLYEDGEVVIFGRYRRPGRGKFKLTGWLGGSPHTLEVEVDLPKEEAGSAWIEKLWAKERVDHMLGALPGGRTPEVRQEITRLGFVYDLVTPYTTFLAVPESEQTEDLKEAMRAGRRGYDKRMVDSLASVRLSQSNFPPGDPVLTVTAPPDARRVMAYFPFGLVKKLRFDPIRSRWAARFLVPRHVPDGDYTIRVLVEHADWTHEWREVSYTIDGAAPEMEVDVDSVVGADELLYVEVDPFEPVREVIAWFPGVDDRPIRLEQDPETGRYYGDIPVPMVDDGAVITLRIVVRDLARNRLEEDRLILVDSIFASGGC